MIINNSYTDNKDEWLSKGYILPSYNREEILANTKKNPEWIHFGAGNIFRAYQANIVETLIDKGLMTTGLIVAEGFDTDIIDLSYRNQDNLGLLVTLKSDGSITKRLIGSVVEALKADPSFPDDFDRLKTIFSAASLKMVSFTITEKGYSLVDREGKLFAAIAADIQNGPLKATSYLGKIASLLYQRFCAGAYPVAMVSMDNCSHNGSKLYEAMEYIIKGWHEASLVDEAFYKYATDGSKISYPWTMIDKITPRPDDSILKLLADDGIEDMKISVTSKNTFIAPFVNAEESEYLVIEDSFPNGKLPLDVAGIIYTDRETVDKVEKMKVCTCLNPLHTALAIFGCILSYDKIYEEMKDTDLRNLVEGIGYIEGMPVVTDPGVIKPEEFLDTVLNVRLPNPFMPDTPQRIATDTSQKLPIRYGETIKAYLNSDTLHISELKLIPLVIAGWCRYLMGINDNGEAFELSSDPLLDKVCQHVKDIQLGGKYDVHSVLKDLLSDATIFAVNLYEAGLGDKIEEYFTEMITGKGAVRSTLIKYLS